MLVEVDTAAPYTPISWLVDGLIPAGMISFIGSQPGAGKTTLLGALAWQMSERSEQTEFLGRTTLAGDTVYVNFDSPTGDGRSLRHLLDQLRVANPEGHIERIHILEPDEASHALQVGEWKVIHDLATATNARLIVLDSFMACFPHLNSNRAEDVMQAMTPLRVLAAATGAAVVVLDHLPKQMPGEKQGARGLMGSNSKKAQARAVHLIHPLDPDEYEGRHLVKFQCQKMTFGAMPRAFAVEYIHTDGGLIVTHGTLDEVVRETKTTQARLLVNRLLGEADGGWVARKALIDMVIAETGLGKTGAQLAVNGLLEELAENVEQRTLSKAGSPLEYRLKSRRALSDEVPPALLAGD